MKTTRFKDLTTTPGPFASVFFDPSQDTESGAHERELRWRAVLDALHEQDADTTTVEALTAAAQEAAPVVGRQGHALIAAGGSVLVDELLPTPPTSPIVRYSASPYLLPLLDLGGPGVPYLLVVADQVGANVRAVDARGRVIDVDSFDLEDHPVHKVGGGGWAHLRMQRTAEETVRRNIGETAERITRLARATGAHVVVLAGQPQSRSALRDALPPESAQHTVEVEVGGRAEGTDAEALDAAVDQMVRLAAEDADNEVRNRFAGALDRPQHLALQGVGRACEALAQANVEALLLDRDGLGDRTVWVGSSPLMLGTQPEMLASMGEPEPREARADEALPLAAVAGGADLVSPGHRLELDGGVGMVLRHA